MPDYQWRYVDELNKPHFIEPDDVCIYAREHHPGGFSVSNSNQAIWNYKIPIDRRETAQWRHKERAISQFANELNVLKFKPGSILIPAATSKPKDHELYDSRLEDTLNCLKNINDNIIIHDLLTVSEEIPDAHHGGPRNPYEIYPYLSLLDTPALESSHAYIVDDVITTGGHFKAFQRKLSEQYPDITFVGIFWALHIFHEL